VTYGDALCQCGCQIHFQGGKTAQNSQAEAVETEMDDIGAHFVFALFVVEQEKKNKVG